MRLGGRKLDGETSSEVATLACVAKTKLPVHSSSLEK